jgi:predicted nucleic acid-binding protein
VLSTAETSTTMLVEPGILDANILAYAVNADAPQHAASRALLEAARDPSIALYVTSQILCEFYSLITNPRRVAVASSPTSALRMISAILAFPGLHVLPTPARAVVGWMELLQRHPVTGGDVFDLQIVATMQANGVQRIYTFNTGDFEVFSELAVVTP